MTWKIIFCFCAETDTFGAEKDIICAETENISAETERFLMNEEILNTRGDQAFYMGAENAKIESAEKSAETGGHQGGGRGVVGVVYIYNTPHHAMAEE